MAGAPGDVDRHGGTVNQQQPYQQHHSSERAQFGSGAGVHGANITVAGANDSGDSGSVSINVPSPAGGRDPAPSL